MAKPRGTQRLLVPHGQCSMVKVTGVDLKIRTGHLRAWRSIKASSVELYQGYKISVSSSARGAAKSGRTR